MSDRWDEEAKQLLPECAFCRGEGPNREDLGCDGCADTGVNAHRSKEKVASALRAAFAAGAEAAVRECFRARYENSCDWFETDSHTHEGIGESEDEAMDELVSSVLAAVTKEQGNG